MKLITFLRMACLVSLTLPVFGEVINEDSRIEPTTSPEVFKLTWQSTVGRTYFIMSSDDQLANWYYLPVIETGTGDRIEYGFTTNAQRFFLRLRYTDEPTANPYTADFDSDGISNYDELLMGTSPFDYNTQLVVGGDADGDGVLNEVDAAPLDVNVGQLTMTITYPAQNSTLN